MKTYLLYGVQFEPIGDSREVKFVARDSHHERLYQSFRIYVVAV
ncbi:MAG TPA: hypothetical protein VEG65_04610 [Candidatus Bathyarchaeia archaeon]|nr:hypothetical protein [Candidatus Bathyarchaeia archaeon]